MNALELRRIHKRWTEGGREILSGVDLRVAEGETLYLVGPNGSGKSTLLKIVAGLVKPDSGRILVANEDVTDLEPERRSAHVAHVAQDASLSVNTDQSVVEHLILARANTPAGVPIFFPKARLRDGLRQRLVELGLGHVAERIDNPVGTLSGGERQALALAMILWKRPRILLLDEFKKELDDRTRKTVEALVARAVTETRPATIVVTHDLEEALGNADRIAVMREGGGISEIARSGVSDRRWSKEYLLEMGSASAWTPIEGRSAAS